MLLKYGGRSDTRFANPQTSIAYQAFIAVDNQNCIDSLRQSGIQVNAVFGDIVTVTIPEQAVGKLSHLAGVRHVSLERPLSLCNDTARTSSNVGPVLAGHGMVAPLNGKGVILGVIDTGIDFNHMNLCGDDGLSRVVAAYLPCDSTGTRPVVQGDTLPGSCYETADQIRALTTDYDASSHGTHTAGTAAGAYKDNGYFGVAPQAELVACGIPEKQLTDVNIANALKYVFDYADRAGKPCVVNMSIGTNEGPNDGSSFLCRTFSELSGPGHICVVSAGNDGDAPICFHDNIIGVGDTVTTLLRNYYGGLERKGYVSMWSDGSQMHHTRLVIINRASGVLEFASPMLTVLPEDSVYSISSEVDQAFAEYYMGEVRFANAFEPRFDDDGNLMQQGRFHSVWDFDVTSVKAGHLIGLQYVADEPVNLAGWCTKDAYFYTFGLAGVSGGTAAGSISDLATTDDVISVGAYCSRKSWTDWNGDLHVISDCTPEDIARFSSFGPDENGITRPDVCAPGMILVSSANRYDEQSNRQYWPQPAVVNGVEYPYYINQGTSMSAPMVSGAVALMLQANPLLTPSDVRQVLARSSKRDNNVLNGDSSRWGSGKLDVAAAIADVVENTLLRGDVNGDGEVNIADIMALVDIIVGTGGELDAALKLRADVNHDSEILLSDVNCIIDLIINNH
ncbi:MAG: S8 family serine peptidase [Muribaculaceae bacterium]|nr:S8 family serine peptidase [Muribaculaceae bacterium]